MGHFDGSFEVILKLPRLNPSALKYCNGIAWNILTCFVFLSCLLNSQEHSDSAEKSDIRLGQYGSSCYLIIWVSIEASGSQESSFLLKNIQKMFMEGKKANKKITKFSFYSQMSSYAFSINKTKKKDLTKHNSLSALWGWLNAVNFGIWYMYGSSIYLYFMRPALILFFFV